MTRDSCLVKRLRAYLDLTEAERRYIASIEDDPRRLAKGDILPVHNGRETVGVLNEGMAVAATVSAGQRRTGRIFVAGELIGLAELGGEFPGQEIAMKTEGVYCPFPRREIGRLISELPRLAALFVAILGVEQITLREQLAAASTKTAEQRLVHLLLDLAARLALPLVGSGNRFHLPLTQAEMGEAIGASGITVNRCLQDLIRRGWIEIERPYVRIKDRPAMERHAEFRDRYAHLDTAWFPDPV